MEKFRHMLGLVTVAKLGSFSAAAKELGMTPGMMSKQVKQLEDELDIRLLHRTTRGVSLTDAGELYVEHSVDILQRVEAAENAVAALAANPRGLLRVNCPPSFGTHVLTPVIAAFAHANPDIRVELGLQDDEPNVIASRLDLIFRLGKLRDSSLIARQVGDAPFALCAAPLFIERHGLPRTYRELAQFNCLIDGSMHADGRWQLSHGELRIDQRISGNFSSLSTEAVIEGAVAGLGIAYVPRYAVIEEIELGEVIELSLEDAEPISLPIFALYGSRAHIAGKIKTFLEFYEAMAKSSARAVTSVPASLSNEKAASRNQTREQRKARVEVESLAD